MYLSFFTEKDKNVVDIYLSQIDSLEEITRIIALLEKINERGAEYLATATDIKTRKLEKDMFEIKFRSNRFIYCYIENNIVYIVHAFTKKSNKAPRRALALARKRIKFIKNE